MYATFTSRTRNMNVNEDERFNTKTQNKKSNGAFNVLLHFTVTEGYLTIKHSSYPNRYVKHPRSCS